MQIKHKIRMVLGFNMINIKEIVSWFCLYCVASPSLIISRKVIPFKCYGQFRLSDHERYENLKSLLKVILKSLLNLGMNSSCIYSKRHTSLQQCKIEIEKWNAEPPGHCCHVSCNHIERKVCTYWWIQILTYWESSYICESQNNERPIRIKWLQSYLYMFESTNSNLNVQLNALKKFVVEILCF